MDDWFHQDHHWRMGRSQLYTDQNICTFLMLKGIFSLSLASASPVGGTTIRSRERPE
jgi:hypothetical protein